MKLHVLSDLHLSVSPFEAPKVDADVVILAGDIARPREAFAWTSAFDRPVIYVPGNHEFYGGSIASTVGEMKRLCERSNTHVLDDDELVIAGIRFLGATLWTDFMLFGAGEQRDRAIRDALTLVRDFSRIRLDDASDALFTPADCAAQFERQASWLESKLAEPFQGRTVIVTHHAPSPQSIHPRFADSPLNACFVSDAERLIDGSRTAVWIHGHTHDSFDYVLNGTRVVCNPRGYARNGVNENPNFDPGFVLELG